MDSVEAADSLFEGGCLCGAVRWRASGPARNLCCCHCRSCRLASGAPFVGWATFDTSSFDVIKGEIRERQSSAQAVRGFCSQCGTAITYRSLRREGELDVALATLDDPNVLAPQFHLWTSHKPGWVVLADGLPQFEEWPASS